MERMFYNKYTNELYCNIEDYDNRTGDIEHNEIYNSNDIISFDRSELGEMMANKIVQPKFEFRLIY